MAICVKDASGIVPAKAIVTKSEVSTAWPNCVESMVRIPYSKFPFGFIQIPPVTGGALAYGLSSRWLGDWVSFNIGSVDMPGEHMQLHL